MSKLLIAELIALSVAKLEAELKTNEYSADELKEAIALEEAKDDARSTAVEALQGALESLEAKVDAEAKVVEGKSITSKRGILAEGEPVSPSDLSGGQKAFDQLIEKGFVSES